MKNSKINSFISSLLNKQIIEPNSDCDDDSSKHYVFKEGYIGLIYSVGIDDICVAEENNIVFVNDTCEDEYYVDMESLFNGHSGFSVVKVEHVTDLF